MRESIDVEGEADVFFCGLDNGLARENARIVNEDCGMADLGPDVLGYGGDLLF